MVFAASGSIPTYHILVYGLLLFLVRRGWEKCFLILLLEKCRSQARVPGPLVVESSALPSSQTWVLYCESMFYVEVMPCVTLFLLWLLSLGSYRSRMKLLLTEELGKECGMGKRCPERHTAKEYSANHRGGLFTKSFLV